MTELLRKAAKDANVDPGLLEEILKLEQDHLDLDARTDKVVEQLENLIKEAHSA